MLDHQEIAARAIALRDNAHYKPSLEAIIAGYAQRQFWNKDPREKKKTLIERLESDESFRCPLAKAVAWTHPREHIPELTLLA